VVEVKTMQKKTDKRLERRAQKLIAERDTLRVKVARIRQSITVKTNAEIVKAVRQIIKKVLCEDYELKENLVEILEKERSFLAAITEAKLPMKK
jgi:methyl coenzyme M reductase subunit D